MEQTERKREQVLASEVKKRKKERKKERTDQRISVPYIPSIPNIVGSLWPDIPFRHSSAVGRRAAEAGFLFRKLRCSWTTTASPATASPLKSRANSILVLLLLVVSISQYYYY